MRNQRNTTNDNYKNQSKERKTGNSHYLYSQNRNHGNNNRANQKKMELKKMENKILDVMLKCPQQPRRGSISTNLPPNQKTFFSTIASLLYMIDNDTQQGSIDLDFVIKTLNFFKYPHHYTKNVFQPIGAQHTWHACLQMLQFIAQLAQFHFQYTLQLTDSSFQKTLIDYILQSYMQTNNQDEENQQDDSLVENWIAQNMKRQKKQQEYMTQKIERMQLQLKNKKNSQKTIPQLQQQEIQKKQALNKQIQIVIQLDQKNAGTNNQIAKVEEDLQELYMEKQLLQKKKKSLQQQMQKQQLNQEEAKQMQIQIEALKKQCNRVKEYHEKKMSEGIKKEKYYIQGFLNFESEIKSLIDIRQNYEKQIIKKGIQIPQINIDHNHLSSYFSETNQNLFEEKIKEIFQTEKIKKMMKGEQFLHNMIAIENRQLNQECNNLIYQINQQDEYIIKLQKQNQKLLQVSNALQEEIVNLQNIDKKLDQDQESYNREDSELQVTIKRYEKEQEKLIYQINQTKSRMTQIMKTLKQFEQLANKKLGLLQEQQQRLKEYLTEKTYNIIRGFDFVTQKFQDMKLSLKQQLQNNNL